jgi:hypothetical protein
MRGIHLQNRDGSPTFLPLDEVGTGQKYNVCSMRGIHLQNRDGSPTFLPLDKEESSIRISTWGLGLYCKLGCQLQTVMFFSF